MGGATWHTCDSPSPPVVSWLQQFLRIKKRSGFLLHDSFPLPHTHVWHTHEISGPVWFNFLLSRPLCSPSWLLEPRLFAVWVGNPTTLLLWNGSQGLGNTTQHNSTQHENTLSITCSALQIMELLFYCFNTGRLLRRCFSIPTSQNWSCVEIDLLINNFFFPIQWLSDWHTLTWTISTPFFFLNWKQRCGWHKTAALRLSLSRLWNVVFFCNHSVIVISD